MDLTKPPICAQLFSIPLGFDGFNVDQGALSPIDARSMLVDGGKKKKRESIPEAGR